LHLVGCTLEI